MTMEDDKINDAKPVLFTASLSSFAMEDIFSATKSLEVRLEYLNRLLQGRTEPELVLYGDCKQDLTLFVDRKSPKTVACAKI